MSGLALVSCSLSQIDDVKLEDRYVADFALPLGRESLTIDEIIEAGQVTQVLPDTVTSGANLFTANGKYYKTPKDYDTLISLEFDMDQTADYLDDIQDFVLRVNLINRSHGTANLQLYFRGDNVMVPIDSAFSKGPMLLSAGVIGGDNVVKPFELWRHDEAFSHDRVLRLKDVTHIDVKAKFTFPTQKTPTVSFVSNEMLWIQLGFKAAIDLNPNEI